MTKGSSHVEITNEDNARNFLRFQGYCSLLINSTRPNIQPSVFYVEILKRLRETGRTKRPEICPNDLIIHYDNVPVHKVLTVNQFLAQKSINELLHISYSSDLAPNVLRLFKKKINSALNG
jgi:hypothetical protein